MFANSFQSGFISIFYSVGTQPLALWDKQVKNGHIRRVVDEEVKSLVLEVSGTNVATTYITCPIKPRASLGIKLPFLVMIIKNMNKYFTFEIQILDDKDMHRRFRVSNFQSTTKVRPFCTTMPIGLSKGWNQVQFNLADFTKRAYGSTYIETQRVQIHANVRIRRIYFSDQLYDEENLPNDFKLFVPTSVQKKESKRIGIKESTKKPSVMATPIAEVADAEVPSGAPPTPREVPTAEDEGDTQLAERGSEIQMDESSKVANEPVTDDEPLGVIEELVSANEEAVPLIPVSDEGQTLEAPAETATEEEQGLILEGETPVMEEEPGDIAEAAVEATIDVPTEDGERIEEVGDGPADEPDVSKTEDVSVALTTDVTEVDGENITAGEDTTEPPTTEGETTDEPTDVESPSPGEESPEE